MQFNDKVKLIILLGALRDVGEKCNVKETRLQVDDIRIKMERILMSDKIMQDAFPELIDEYLNEHQKLNDTVEPKKYYTNINQ